MRAVIAHVAESGYQKASVSALVRRAGVARNTFYTAFRGKEHAFTAAFEWIVERVEVEVRESGDVVGALVDFVHCEPDAARCALIEAPAAIPASYDTSIARAVEKTDLGEPLARMVVGGVEAILRRAAGKGESIDLEGLRAFVAPHFESRVPA